MKAMRSFLLAVLVLGGLPWQSGCERKPAAPGSSAAAPAPSRMNAPAAPTPASETAGIAYEDRAEALGVRFQHTDGSSGRYFVLETLASGVCLFDYNEDGRLDLYFPNGRMLPPGAKPAGTVIGAHPSNVLFRQNPGGTFTEATQEAGVPGTLFGVGACAGDYDGDGHLDLFVTQYGTNLLYRNNGNGAFIDVTEKAGLKGQEVIFGAGAVFFDYDLDGDLDLYVTNYCKVDFEKDLPFFNNNIPGYRAPEQYTAVPDFLYRNDGDGTFTDVSAASGIRAPEPGRGMGVIATDLDGDRWPDLYVANDGSENFLFMNLGNGAFKEIGLTAGVALDLNGDEQGSMGVDAADFNGDGRLDIVVTNYQKQTNALYRQGSNGFYTDVGMESQMATRSLPLVAWGTKFFDYDNDGILDLFIANGHLEDHIEQYDQSSTYKQQNQLLRGLGNGKFDDLSDRSGPGLKIVKSSRGAAFGDLDNDGDTDIVILNSRDQPDVLINQGGNRNHWIGLELIGKRDRFAFGARAILHAGGNKQIQEVRSSGSYISQNDLRLLFGLGQLTAIEKIDILWPDRTQETVTGVPIDRYSKIRQGEGMVKS
ncbi:MAG: CRTAC1 family protein [Planctomycetes bacterium]|nr:CRTAC1 family protein [Planctomycetota bacterium]